MRLTCKKQCGGGALVTVVVIIGISLLMLGAMLTWMSTNKSLTYRYNQYTRSVAAAEAATEKVILAINQDYKALGHAYVINNIDKYRSMVPTPDEDGAWANYVFSNQNGTKGVQVEYAKGTNLIVISSRYPGLLGFPGRFRVTARAQEINSSLTVQGAVEQQVNASLIPIFQFAMFYNLDYECGAGPAMVINGPVHCNGNIYTHPGTGLTYNNDVTCTKKVLLRTVKPGNPNSPGTGPVTFKGAKDGGVNTLTLPIGTNNSIAAVRQVIEVPAENEDHLSPMGQQRFYNKANLLILVSNNSIRATSGRLDSFNTDYDVSSFVRTNVYFYNGREKKQVQCTEINIGEFKKWNDPLLDIFGITLFPGKGIDLIYVADFRTPGTNQPGIRLVNGQTLPGAGLTVASPQPIYLKGHYNCPNNAHLGTTNTSATAPASIIADAITALVHELGGLH